MHLPNIRCVLRSFIPDLIYKCIQFAFSASQAKENLRTVGRDLAAKGCPQSWWLGAAKTALCVQHVSLRADDRAIMETYDFLFKPDFEWSICMVG